MVALTQVSDSNSRVRDLEITKLVALFVGATSGIGENTLKQFARHARSPRIYFTGRSEEAAIRIKAECGNINPAGEYIFLRKDTSLMRNVDAVCNQITEKEQYLNVLFMSSGTLTAGTDTEEGIHSIVALTIHSRYRFARNLLPLLRRAPTLRRVISVSTGTKEGEVVTSDLQGRHVSIMAARSHFASVGTICLLDLAKQAPEVSFIHNFPCFVEGRSARDSTGIAIGLLKFALAVLGPLIYMKPVECGDRHTFLATSSRYPAEQGGHDGVSLQAGLKQAVGADGHPGSGVYTVDQYGEAGAADVIAVIDKLKASGVDKSVIEAINKDIEVALNSA